MKDFELKNILTPTDFSNTANLAIEHAAFLARRCKANLYLLHVIKESEFLFSKQDIFAKGLKEMETCASEEIFTLAAELKRKYSINIVTILCKGNPSVEIMKAVNDHQIDLVIMGTHGASGFNEYFIGSNAHKTIKLCPCPVLTIQVESHKIGFQNIVLPIENSYHSLEKVNRTVELAKIYSAKIHLLGLLNSTEEVEKNKFNLKMELIEKVISQGGVFFDRTIVHGENLAHLALDFSTQIGADLIVVLTDHESELNEVVFSAFAKKIVNHSKIPVLSIRPKKGNFASMSPT